MSQSEDCDGELGLRKRRVADEPLSVADSPYPLILEDKVVAKPKY